MIIDNNNFQVMMEWEKPYMEKLVDRLSPTGDVLEVGFGMGYSADAIQLHDIKSHTIIESDPVVLERLYTWADQQKHEVVVINGTWQNKLSSLGSYDSIFFDDSPHDSHPDPDDARLVDFYYEILASHANVGCKMVWYCDTPIYWVANSWTTWSNSFALFDVPDNVRYLHTGEVLFMPLVTFPYGSIPNIEKITIRR